MVTFFVSKVSDYESATLLYLPIRLYTFASPRDYNILRMYPPTYM